MKHNRRKNLKLLTLLLSSSLTPVPELLSRHLLKRGSTEKLRGDVGIFKGRGGTIVWLINDDGIAVVDSQFPQSANDFINFAKDEAESPFKYLINTHHHGDHSSGNIAFKNLVEEVVAHENSKLNQQNSAKSRGNEDKQLYPSETFKKSWKGKVGNETITSNYFGAAHTNGDSVIHFEEANVAHVGDLVFNRRHPYIDHSAGASIENWISVLESMHKFYNNDTIFISGHAGSGYDVIMKPSDLLVMKNYLESLFNTVSEQLNKGKSEEDILKIDALPGVKWKGDNIQRPLKAAIHELTR